MSKSSIERAWKDEDYFDSLSDDARNNLPENPAGINELQDADLANVSGDAITTTVDCFITSVIIGATISICSPSGTLCGSCSFGTRACCSSVQEITAAP